MSGPNGVIGTVVPLPYLGAEQRGTVIGQTWSEALGLIWRIREHAPGSAGSVRLVYGDDLASIRAALGVSAG